MEMFVVVISYLKIEIKIVENSYENSYENPHECLSITRNCGKGYSPNSFFNYLLFLNNFSSYVILQYN